MKESYAFYQVKQILENLLDKDYKKIPKEVLEIVDSKYEENAEYKIDFSIPLNEQKLDIKVYEILETLLDYVEDDEAKDNIIQRKEQEIQKGNENISKLREQIELVKQSNEYLKEENEMLKAQIDSLPKFVKNYS